MINKQKIKDSVDMYLKHVNDITLEKHITEEEGYKFKAVDNFQKNFDLEAKDLADTLDKAIVNNNMAVGSWYFPRKMIALFAEENTEETRNALRNLFDKKIPVEKRIDKTEEVFEDLMEKRNILHSENSHSFIGLRFISLLLGYMYPNNETALKPREWKKFCSFIDDEFSIPNRTSPGEKYLIFKKYIEAVREYAVTVPEVDRIRKEITNGLDFKDDEFRWITQDIIYITSRMITPEPTKVSEKILVDDEEEENPDEEGKTPATTGDKFFYEEDLQNFVAENLEKLNIGEGLKIYSDDKGRSGLYYPVAGGEIDILTTDKDGNFVVIELKRDRTNANVVGQILGYINFVEENLCQSGKTVRGIIICGSGNENLKSAVRAMNGKVQVHFYNLKLELFK